MRERSWKARRDKLLAEEAHHPFGWWWLSFAGEEGFRGAVLTRARGFISAIERTHLLGINPGGEVRGVEVPEEAMRSADGIQHAQHADRLLSRKDIEEKLGGAANMPEEL